MGVDFRRKDKKMNFVNEEKIKKMIGKTKIDRVELQDGKIVNIGDMDSLIEKCIVINNTTPNCYTTNHGQQFSSLNIKNDGAIHRLKAGWSGYGREYVTLTTGVCDDQFKNFIGNDVKAYHNQINDIEKLLENKYQIQADFSKSNIKYIELNRTFEINHQFEDYRRVLNLIIAEMPRMNIVSTFGRTESNDESNDKFINISTYTAWNRRNGTGRAKSFKSITFYDKKRQLKGAIYLNGEYMRFEIKLAGLSNIKKAFGTTQFYKLSDEFIDAYFQKKIEELIIRPISKWKMQRDKYLLKLMKTEREKDIHNWQVNVLRALNTKENQQNGKPCLLGVGELVELVDQLKDVKRKQRVKNTFITQAHKYEKIFCNHDEEKLIEIIEKLTKKPAERDSIVAHLKVA